MRLARSVRGKLLSLVALWTIPVAIAVGILVDRNIGKNIRFAETEKAGNAVQRPLLALVASLRRIGLLAATGRLAQEQGAIAVSVEAAFAEASADAERGATLVPLQSQWQPVAEALERGESPDLAALEQLVQDARRLALLAGATSNLALDPDLDTYYLLDLTNLALPDAIARLGRLASLRRDVPAGNIAGRDAMVAFGSLAALIEEVDLPRIARSTLSALAADEHFQGTSDSLPARMTPALARYESAAQLLVERLRTAATDPLVTAPLDEPALALLQESEALWKVASDELGVQLTRRIDAQQRERFLALGLAIAVVLAATLTGRHIAKTIVRSLERSRAMAEQVAAGDLAGARNAATAGAVAQDESGALLQSLSSMAGQLGRIVSEVVASTSAISDVSADLEAKTVEISTRAHNQRQAIGEVRDITCEVLLATEQAADHGGRLTTAAESTRSSMAEIETQAAAIEGEMELLSAVVSQLLTAMQQMAANSRSIATAADSLRTAGDETVHSVEDLRRSISSIEDCASSSQNDASAMVESAEQGELATRDSMAANQEILDAFAALSAAIEQLSGRSSRIEQVLAVIDGVADEVGLLSLNASIIAAQSGEHGRSFAIVANEIGELARETEASSGEIAKNVAELQQDIHGVSRAVAAGTDQVRRGFERAQEADATLHGLAQRARASAERAREITQAAAAQSLSVAAVERAASAVHGGVIEIGSSVLEYSAAVGSVRDMVTGVDGLTKSVLSAAALQTAESSSVSKSMRELIEHSRALENAAALQREATGRMGSSISVFRSGAEGTDDLVSELGRIVELLRERSTALASEVARFRV